MGFFSKRKRPSPDSDFTLQLIEKFSLRAEALGLEAGEEIIRNALRQAQQLAAEEDKIYKLPDHYGDFLLWGAEQGRPDCQEFVGRVMNGGALAEDVQAWWNLPDLERRMYEWENDALLNRAYGYLLQQNFSEQEAFTKMSQMLPFYGDPADESMLSGADRPLPPEMRLWVFSFIQSKTEQLHPGSLGEEAASYSSMNAYLRMQRSLLDWSELMAPVSHYFHQNQLDKAVEEAEKLVSVLEEKLSTDDPVRKKIMIDLVPVFMAGGRYEVNVPWLERAVQETPNEASNYPVLLNNLGQHYTEMGRNQEAANSFQEALVILKTNPERATKDFLWVRIMHNLALAFARAMQYAEAVPLYESAIQFLEAQETEIPADLLDLIRSNLSLSYLGLERLEEAFDLQKKVLESRKKELSPNHPYLATSLDSLGNILMSQGEFAKSIEYLEQAAHIREESLGNLHPDFTLSLSNLALAYAHTENWEKVVKNLSQAVHNRLDQIRHQFLFLTESEQQSFYHQLNNELDFFRGLSAKLHQNYPEMLPLLLEVQLLSRGLQIRSLRQLKQHVFTANDPELLAEFEEWIEVKSRLAEGYAMSDPQGQKTDWERRAKALEENLKSESTLFIEELARLPDWKDVHAALKEGDFLVECFAFTPIDSLISRNPSKSYGALVISSTHPSPIYVPFAEKETSDAQLLKSYHQFLGFSKNKRNRSLDWEVGAEEDLANENLFHEIWQPIQESITGAKKMYLLPDGIFYQINVETLWNPHSEQYLGEELEIQVLNHVSDLIQPKRPTSQRPAVLMGDPDFGLGNIAPLPGTRTEVESISSLFQANGKPTQVFLGADAISFTLKAVERPSILHLATHGFFEKEVKEGKSLGGFQKAAVNRHPYLRSGLLLTGAAAPNPNPDGIHPGVITAYEAANLNLLETELVVLSACNTGSGEIQDAEGAYGLSRAFREAGAQAVLYSLWPVADEATAELMSLFYQYWLAGESLRVAFRKAQHELRTRYPEPMYWGAFVLV